MDPPDQAVAQWTDKHNQTLTTKKFKLRSGLKGELETYADQHYQGNSSALIRVALKAHFRSLEGENEYAVKELEKRIADLEQQIGAFLDQIDENLEQLSKEDTVDRSVMSESSADSNQNDLTVETAEPQGSADLQNEIYLLLSEQGPMTVPEIANQIDEDPLKIHVNISQLIEEYGLIGYTEENDTARCQVKNQNSSSLQ
jgi:predicted transcriptional regulator